MTFHRRGATKKARPAAVAAGPANEILNIVEGEGVQVFFQEDVEWHYLGEERRWRSTNDNSGWRMIRRGREKNVERLHIN